MKNPDSSLADTLLAKIRTLNETIWEDRITRSVLDDWIQNFARSTALDKIQRTNLLYLASKLIYFGDREIRELLRSLYRDLFCHPLKRQIRRELNDTLDFSTIAATYEQLLGKTRFFGMGNPSESGTHLLYYFRQENQLAKELFESPHRIFIRGHETGTRSLRDAEIERYIFIDDFCASGTQALEYSSEIVSEIKDSKPKYVTTVSSHSKKD